VREPKELIGRIGKAQDGVAKTRMAWLGCVFTQHKQDQQGRPMRDHESTTYLSGFESILTIISASICVHLRILRFMLNYQYWA
jgi:hypothetical protein